MSELRWDSSEWSTWSDNNPEAAARLASIAKDIMHLETLNIRSRDSLDFREQAVWAVREALRRAYVAGFGAASKQGVCT